MWYIYKVDKNALKGYQMKITYISSPTNLFYYSSLKNNDARILLCGHSKYYITDNRFIFTAKNKLRDYIVVSADKISLVQQAINIINQLKASTLAVEGNSLNMLEYLDLKKSLKDIKIIDNSEKINNKRIKKRKEEINYIAKAQEISDHIYLEIIHELFEGITEKEIAILINKKILEKKCIPAFDTIVAFAENSACPHAIPSNKPLRAGDAVVIDFGVQYNNYCSDMTRSFSYKFATDEYKKAYNYVLSAQNAAINNIKSGIEVKKLDHIARTFLESYQQYFIHALGHGIGIDIHEKPRISTTSNDILLKNTVVTIEPGVYIENKFGIRIEDLIVVKQQGACNLTKSPKNMIIK